MRVPLIFKMLAVTTILSTTAFFVGAGIAADSIRNSFPASVPPQAIKEVTIQKELVKVQTEYVQPESCARVTELAKAIHQSGEELSENTAILQRVSDNLGRAIMLSQISDLNTAKEQLNKYNGGSAPLYQEQTKALNLLEDSLKECSTETSK